MTRRSLILAVLLAAPVVHSDESRPIRVLLVANGNPSVIAGANFGADEAMRTARLFGRAFELTSRAEDPADAILVAGNPPKGMSTRRTPVLRIGAPAAPQANVYALSARRGSAWKPTLEKFGAGELNERFRRATGKEMNSDAYLAWLAMKIVLEAALRKQPVGSVRVDGHKGVPLRFDEHRILQQPVYE